MMVSSTSTRTRPVSMPVTSGVFAARLLRNREATASDPKVSWRRKDPRVDGA